MTANYFNPVQSVYGPGALLRLPQLLAGRKAALVTFPEARAIGLLGRLEAVMGDSLACVIDQVRPNPDVAELAATWECFWRDHADVEVIVAVGGGSAIDTAKALMVGNTSNRFDELVAGLAGQGAFAPTRFKHPDCGAHHRRHRQ
jgi:alcohol dehydrogenase class IV